MLKYVCLCKVFYLIIYTVDMSLSSSIRKPISREQIYMEVLRNITQVNNVLNDLLANYKHLKELYDAQAKSENELSGDIEFSEENHIHHEKSVDNNEQEYHPVTQMILLDEGFSEESSDKSIENIDIREKHSKISDILTGSIDKTKSVNNYIEEAKKDMIDLTRANTFQYGLQKTEVPVNQSNKSDLIIIGTPLKYAVNMLNLDDENDNSEKGLSLETSAFSLNKPVLRNEYSNKDEDIKKLRNGENINDFSYYQSLEETESKQGNVHKERNLLLFVVPNNQMKPLYKTIRYDSDSDSGEEEILRREQLKSQILRDAYGSACLKVAVRKCFKTLVLVRKLICTTDYKCRSSFKEHFKSYSKVGCMKEFNYKGDGNNEWNNKRILRNQTVKVDAEALQENTRGSSKINYYELCLPVMAPSVVSNDKSKIGKNQPRDIKKLEPINVLRDDYERECKRMSSMKCERACNYAVTNTCEQHSCQRDEKKSFTHTCKKECNASFVGDDSDSDSDDDSNDSDDSDYSGSDNDDSDDSGEESMTIE